jgi:hypothetical protein
MRSFAILFTLVVSQVAWAAGTTLEFQDEGSGETGSQMRMLLQGDKLRVDHTSQGIRHSTIFDGTQVITFDERTKTYQVIDPATVKMQMEALKQMEAKLPPETRAQLEKAKADQGLDYSHLTFKKAAGGDTVAGFSCSNYTELHDGQERATICVTSWSSAPVKKDEAQALSKHITSLLSNEFTKKVLFFDADQWPGFPVSTRTQDGKITRLTSAKKGAIPESEFQPPAGYTKRAMPGMGKAAPK